MSVPGRLRFVALLLILSGCGAPQPVQPVAEQPVADEPGIKVESNELLGDKDSKGSSPVEPSREALSGTWVVRNGDSVLTLLFLEPGDGRGPLSRSTDGTTRLSWEGGYGSIGSTSADVAFDTKKKHVAFYPGGSLNQSTKSFGPPESFGTATLTGDKTLEVRANIPGHVLWRLNVTFVKVP